MYVVYILRKAKLQKEANVARQTPMKVDNKESRDIAGRAPRREGTGLYIKTAKGLRLRHRKVRRLVEKIRASMPWLERSDVPACRAWAELEILGATVFAELHLNGITNVEGEPRRLLTEYRQLRQAQLAYERELGMTPAARMAIKANGTRAALDLAAAMAKADETDISDGELGRHEQ